VLQISDQKFAIKQTPQGSTWVRIITKTLP